MTCYICITEIIMFLGCKGCITWPQDHGSYTSPGNVANETEMRLKSKLGCSASQGTRLKMKPKGIF